MTVERAERLYLAVNEAMKGRRSWVGLGLENVPNKPFGWAWNEERRAIVEHLAKRGIDGSDRHFRAVRIQQRLHRNVTSYRDRQAAWQKRIGRRLTPPLVAFTREELEALVELFLFANEPLSVSIGQKSAAMLDRMTSLPKREA